MRRAEKRVSLHEACADQKKAAILYQVEAIRAQVEPLIALAQERARTAYQERATLVADLQTGDVGRRLRDLREEIESAVVHYKEHERAQTQVKRKLLTVIAKVHEKRTSAYSNLQRLRMEYAPAWHFGGGERAYSSRETQKWYVLCTMY
jgi:ribosomal protein L17